MPDKQETSYVNYPLNTRVKVKETGEYGDAFESSFGCISVFLDSQDKAVLFKMEEVEFLEKLNQKPMTDKQPQTVYVRTERAQDTGLMLSKYSGQGLRFIPVMGLKKFESVYIHTPEELAKAFREVARKSFIHGMEFIPVDPSKYDEDAEEYLNQHYPLPQPIK